jgi:Undecaprenyl-phosphate glucose phosphotransferase
MIKSRQRFFNGLNILTDGILIMLSYFFSAWLWLTVLQNQSPNLAAAGGGQIRIELVALVYAASMVALLALFRLYKSSRVHSARVGIAAIWRASLVGILAVGTLLFVFRLEEFSRGVLLIFFLSSGMVLSGKRLLLKAVLTRMRREGYNQKHVVVVGKGELAQGYIRDVRQMSHLGFCVHGYYSDAPAEEIDARYLGSMDAMEAKLQDSSIDEVIIALEPDEVHHVAPAIALCEKCGTKVSVIPFYNEIIPSNPVIEIIGKTKLINLRGNPLDVMGYAVIKRGFDILGSMVLLLLLSPVLIIAAAGTRLSSPGPVFFRQQRIGRNKKLFVMYKFRSMRVNDEEDSGWTTDGDERKTAFGSFLRKCSIDELPQLFNVIKGDMSLVGPRPEIPFFVEQFKESIPLYMVKHQVRPGMTGWAQVNGYRGDTSIEKRIEHDIWYIENWSVGLDLQILGMTVMGGWLNREKVV